MDASPETGSVERRFTYTTVDYLESPVEHELIYRGERVVRRIDALAHDVVARGDEARCIVMDDGTYERLTAELWALVPGFGHHFPREVLGLPIYVVPIAVTYLEVCGSPERDFTRRVIAAERAKRPSEAR